MLSRELLCEIASDEVVPLLKEFIGLENLEMTQKAYDSLRDIWPNNGLPTERGLKNVMSIQKFLPVSPWKKSLLVFS